jgi:hypothetical protein
VIFLFLLWSSTLQFQITTQKADISRSEGKWKAIEKDFLQGSEQIRKSTEYKAKIQSLTRLSTNRFLWGNALNALQEIHVPRVQLTKIRTDQSYTIIEAVAAKKTGKTNIPAVPAKSTEKITLFIDARDYNRQAEDNYNRYKNLLMTSSFFRPHLQKPESVKLGSLSGVIQDAAQTNRSFITFSLECVFPPLVRNE